MRIVVLASGSEGNSTYLEINGKKFLFDCGRNAKYIKEKLKEIGVSFSEIDGIFISHDHDDHISALKVLVKKDKPIIYLTSKMLDSINYLKEYPNLYIYDNDFVIDDINIKTIHASHDSSDSRNFIISNKDKKIVYLTDTGYLNRKYFRYLENANYYLMESNHDIQMLLDGPYPMYLKQRILGTLGHLSNKDSSFYLSKLIGDKTEKVVLMHLSRTNNTEEKALETFNNTMKEYDINFHNVMCANKDSITEVLNDQVALCR